MTSLIIDIIIKIIDIVNQNDKIRKEEKENISNILNDISEIILDTSIKLKKNEYPHNNCVVMEKLANNLHLNLNDYIEPNQLDFLHKLLIESSNIEKLYNERQDEELLRNLMRISGEFKAMSLLISV